MYKYTSGILSGYRPRYTPVSGDKDNIYEFSEITGPQRLSCIDKSIFEIIMMLQYTGYTLCEVLDEKIDLDFQLKISEMSNITIFKIFVQHLKKSYNLLVWYVFLKPWLSRM